MRIDVGYDSSIFIDRAIRNVFKVIGEAVLFVLVIIFLFLRSVRVTLIPLGTISVSPIGALASMLALGFSINTLTLLAFVLAVGLVVYDAIVMFENIARYIKESMEPIAAAIKCAREIGLGVVPMTITLPAVYVPMAFQAGRTGRLFVEFALMLAAAVIVSGFVALTLTPMMWSRLLRHEAERGGLYRFGERALEGLTAGYRAALRAALGLRPIVFALALLVGGFSAVMRGVIKSNSRRRRIGASSLASRSRPMGRRSTTPSAGFARSSAPSQELRRSAATSPSPASRWSARGSCLPASPLVAARVFVGCDRPVVVPSLLRHPGVLAFPVLPPSLGHSATDKPVQFVLQTSGACEEL